MRFRKKKNPEFIRNLQKISKRLQQNKSGLGCRISAWVCVGYVSFSPNVVYCYVYILWKFVSYQIGSNLNFFCSPKDNLFCLVLYWTQD